MSSSTQKTLLYQGISFPYFEYHSDQKSTIVMIHGLRGTHDGLELIANALPSYRIIIPDLPGFGDAPGFEGSPHDLEQYVRYVIALIKETTSEPPVLLGHSFGSIVVSALAAKHPEIITKLVLINPIGAPALEGPKAVLTKIALFYYQLGAKLPEQAGKLWLSTQFSTDVMSRIMTKTSDPEIRKYIRDQHRQYFSKFANRTVVKDSFATSVQHTVRDFAPIIKTPTLMIVGEKDDITPLAKQKELVELFEDATLDIIMKTGHLVHYETPNEAADLIKKFLQ